MFARVRIESRNSHGSFFDAESCKSFSTSLHVVDDPFLCDHVEHVAQRHVSCKEEHSHAVCLEHRQRVVGLCELSENLGVSDKVNLSGADGFLVDRSCCYRISLACHREFYALLDVLECSLAAHCTDLAVFKLVEINIGKIDKIEDSLAVVAVCRILYTVDFQVNSRYSDRLLHDTRIADHYAVCLFKEIFICNSLYYDLRADSGRISQSNSNEWFFHIANTSFSQDLSHKHILPR